MCAYSLFVYPLVCVLIIMVQSGYGYILCQVYMVADGCGADNGVAQSDSGIFPDNQVAYSICLLYTSPSPRDA